MSTTTLHDAFALLVREREHEGKRATLSAETARTIRRHIGARWAGRLGALVVAGSLGAAALGGTGGAGGGSALESPVPTPTIGFAEATFPLTGGPEFVPASAGLRCGDPAPAQHPVDHDLSLTLAQGTVFALGNEGLTARPITVQAVVKQVTTADKGTVSTSGVDFLIVEDGIIRGMIEGSGVGLAQNVVSGTVSIPQSLLTADGAYCSDGSYKTPAGIEPGTYDVVAVGRVFSTAESVALAQTLGDTINTMYLNPNTLADPAALYLPGIYDCETARDWGSALRGCLPEITDKAVVDEAAGTVTVAYITKYLVDEFSAVLVSEPMTIEIVGEQGPESMAASGGRPLATIGRPVTAVDEREAAAE